MMLRLLGLIMCLASATNAKQTECYSCHGILARPPNCGSNCNMVADPDFCGEMLDLSSNTPTASCDGICMTKKTYVMDEKYLMDRQCVSKCEAGCWLTFGTGACMSCCDGDLCNAANGRTASIWLLGTVTMATITALL